MQVYRLADCVHNCVHSSACWLFGLPVKQGNRPTLLAETADASSVSCDRHHPLQWVSVLTLNPTVLCCLLWPLPSGLVYRGSSARLRRVVSRLLQGEHVHIGAVGSSITYGRGVERGTSDWLTLFSSWLQAAFPTAVVSVRNGALPLATSEYLSACLDQLVEQQADLVFVEVRWRRLKGRQAVGDSMGGEGEALRAVTDQPLEAGECLVCQAHALPCMHKKQCSFSLHGATNCSRQLHHSCPVSVLSCCRLSSPTPR